MIAHKINEKELITENVINLDTLVPWIISTIEDACGTFNFRKSYLILEKNTLRISNNKKNTGIVIFEKSGMKNDFLEYIKISREYNLKGESWIAIVDNVTAEEYYNLMRQYYDFAETNQNNVFYEMLQKIRMYKENNKLNYSHDPEWA